MIKVRHLVCEFSESQTNLHQARQTRVQEREPLIALKAMECSHEVQCRGNQEFKNQPLSNKKTHQIRISSKYDTGCQDQFLKGAIFRSIKIPNLTSIFSSIYLRK